MALCVGEIKGFSLFPATRWRVAVHGNLSSFILVWELDCRQGWVAGPRVRKDFR